MAESNAVATMEGVADRYIAAWNQPDTDAGPSPNCGPRTAPTRGGRRAYCPDLRGVGFELHESPLLPDEAVFEVNTDGAVGDCTRDRPRRGRRCVAVAGLDVD